MQAMKGFASWVTANPLDEHEEDTAPDNTLHDAALWGNVKMVTRILESGRIDVNQTTSTKETALMWAAQEGHFEVVELLLARGARADLRDERGRTASDMARRQGHVDVLAELEAARKKAEERGGKKKPERLNPRSPQADVPIGGDKAF